MFCDKMVGARGETSRKKAGHQEVNKGLESEYSNENVKGGLGKEVVDMPFRRCLGPYKAWPVVLPRTLLRQQF